MTMREKCCVLHRITQFTSKYLLIKTKSYIIFSLHFNISFSMEVILYKINYFSIMKYNYNLEQLK